MQILEGMSVTLDSHLSDMLDIYTKERNQFINRELRKLGIGWDDCEGYAAHPEEIARQILTQFLNGWLERRGLAEMPPAFQLQDISAQIER